MVPFDFFGDLGGAFITRSSVFEESLKAVRVRSAVAAKDDDDCKFREHFCLGAISQDGPAIHNCELGVKSLKCCRLREKQNHKMKFVLEDSFSEGGSAHRVIGVLTLLSGGPAHLGLDCPTA